MSEHTVLERQASDKTIIVSDLHGDWENCLRLLIEQEVVSPCGQRLPGWRTIQIGDLIHGGHGEAEQDEDCALHTLPWFDVVLIGNHELPHLFSEFEKNFGFRGQTPITERTRELLMRAYAQGKLRAAASVGGWLVTHAGLNPLIDTFSADSMQAAAHINVLFSDTVQGNQRYPTFDWIGWGRGGPNPCGGVFWEDWNNLVSADPTRKQIVGHTPQKAGFARHGSLWCVDAGARLSGRVSALISDDGTDWTPVVR